jgi:hypothetical protein
MSRIGEERLLAFDFGLNGLRRVGDIPRLPDETTPPPADSQPIQHLDALFDAPTADDALNAMSVPDIADPKVLEPTIYAAALDDAREVLLRLASATAADAGIFASALAVVESAQSDRAVLDAARRALMRA